MNEIKNTQIQKRPDRIRGSLVGGAIGDALGYPVEFLSADQIFCNYGSCGITKYVKSTKCNKALISDDTQMTLFTANGILINETYRSMQGSDIPLRTFIHRAYLDWLITQEVDYETGQSIKLHNESGSISWLLDVPELYSRRAPGNTCLSALYTTQNEGVRKDCIKNPLNNSKGCGAIMRIAPLALYYADTPVEELDREAAVLSALTHGHPLGYLSSSVLVHIINRIMYADTVMSLKDIVKEAADTVCRLFHGIGYIDELRAIIDKSITLAENNDTDINNITKLGEGWVAEETLAIAIYCALRYEYDFSGGIIAAVNHNGDSDSTGAVVGNILGAINGYAAIQDCWKKDLELHDIILEMADDLCLGYRTTAEWTRKYIDAHWI